MYTAVLCLLPGVSPLWKWCVLLGKVQRLGVLATTTVSLHCTHARVHNPKCLCVLAKCLSIGVVVHPASLSLATEEFFQRVLTELLTQERCYPRYLEHIRDKLKK